MPGPAGNQGPPEASGPSRTPIPRAPPGSAPRTRPPARPVCERAAPRRHRRRRASRRGHRQQRFVVREGISAGHPHASIPSRANEPGAQTNPAESRAVPSRRRRKHASVLVKHDPFWGPQLVVAASDRARHSPCPRSSPSAPLAAARGRGFAAARPGDRLAPPPDAGTRRCAGRSRSR